MMAVVAGCADGGERSVEGGGGSRLRRVGQSERGDASLGEEAALDVSGNGLRGAGWGRPFLPRMDQIRDRFGENSIGFQHAVCNL